MLESLVQPAHLVISLTVFLLYVCGPIGFAIYLAVTLSGIRKSIETIARNLEAKS